MLKGLLKLDWILITAAVLLLGLSLAVLYPISYGQQDTNLDASHFFRQLVFVFLGLAVFIFFVFSDYRLLRGYSTALYLAGALFLFLVLIFGKTVRGTTGWIGISGFNLQPVEIFKVIIAITLAKYFSMNSRSIREARHIFISAVPVIFATLLVLKQPDLGSALIMLVAWVGALIVSGTRKKYIFLLIIAGIVLSLFSWNYLLKDYQKERILALRDPFADPKGTGYNIIQSTVAVGSGGFWGKGLGHGSQSQLNFLPEKHTDFIFAVIAEELGVVGAVFVLALMATIVIRLLSIARNSRDNFGKILVSTFAVIILAQAVINIGMNIGVMPITGIPLPFLSYGGSSLISMIAVLGISQSVYRKGGARLD